MSVSPTHLFDPPPGAGIDAAEALAQAARERILILDGAMGTQIQDLALEEDHFRGERFVGCECHLKGNNDLLTLTQPQAIEDIHFAYAMAGADILETNTFSSTRIAQADYGMQEVVYELNRDGARLARRAALKAERIDGKRRFVAGALGPTNRTASISPDVNNPGFRAVTFDELREAYAEQIVGLIDGGADIILIETIFDTLNAKAAIFACEEIFAAHGAAPAADDLRHDHRPLRPHAVGADADRVLAFGAPRPARSPSASIARSARARCASISRRFPASPTRSSAPIPTPACPTNSASTTKRPEQMAAEIAGFARDGLVNVVGGCCGSTPEHIRAIAEAVRGVEPRVAPTHARR